MKRAVAILSGLLLAGAAFADVSVVERQGLTRRGLVRKIDAKKKHPRPVTRFGDQALTDASGLEYFINSNITLLTTSSASGAASEASYTGPVNADTSGGGTVSTTLTDAFDGYNAICVSTTGNTGPCSTGNAGVTIYNNNGAGTLDASCGGRQVILNAQTIGSLSVQRKILVPSNDEFARFLDIVTNNGGGTQTVTLITSNNLGSDANTTIFGSSNGNTTAELTDSWVATDGNFVGLDATDPRLGHVLQGPGARTPLASVNFPAGAAADLPTWAYTFSLAPGETKIIMNFVTGQPTRAEARAKSAELAGLPTNALQCLSPAETAQIVNFEARGVTAIPTASGFGLAALALLLAGASFFVLRRRTV
ncbi:MAG TPA: hypothetical protein VN851_27285 [Thermoanaerobaculia bacterium]|nr:hypothetical protein [Thermoanaerobaculia bacterium]